MVDELERQDRLSMTDNEVVELRLKQLEEIAAGARSTERDVDLLKVQAARLEALLVELRTEVRGRDDHVSASLARLHDRLDRIVRDEHEERGASRARSQMWRVVAATIAAVAAITGMVVGVVAVL
jgi:anti-sigma-K factor RskA